MFLDSHGQQPQSPISRMIDQIPWLGMQGPLGPGHPLEHSVSSTPVAFESGLALAEKSSPILQELKLGTTRLALAVPQPGYAVSITIQGWACQGSVLSSSFSPAVHKVG